MSVYEKLKARTGFTFDPVALEKRYREERDKRVRKDAEDQFIGWPL